MANNTACVGEVAELTNSLVVLPQADSQLVLAEEARLLGSIDLEALVDDLGRLGNCVRIAYHGVTGYAKLQRDIQRIGYDVTRLCDKSAITVGKFKKASTTVLSSLKATYEFLMDSFEDMALDTLADVADTAKEMATAAEELHRDFDSQAKKVIDALETTQETHASEETRKKQMEMKRKKMEEAAAEQEESQKKALELQRRAELLAREANAKENEAVQTLLILKEEEHQRYEKKGWFWGIFHAFSGQSDRDTAALTANLRTNEEKARAAREERMRYLEVMRQQQEMRRQALSELAKYAKKIEHMEDDENQVKVAIDALLNAVQALKSLAAIMMQAALFWYQLQDHCEYLAKDDMKKMIEKAMKYPESRRIKLWNSPAFKGKAWQYYAGWIALDRVCGIYMERIKLTQRELYTYIQEALSTEDARKKVKELAANFASDLEAQQKVIAEKKAAHSKEIQDLKDEAKKAADDKQESQDADRKQE